MEQTASVNADPAQRSDGEGRFTQWRTWVAFWILGLCNNFAYVVMLSAAHDILNKQESANTTVPTSATTHFQGMNSRNSSRYDCNPVSTAAVLLADILPTLVIKLVAPFVIHKLPYGIRVLFCALMAAASFLLVSFSSAVWMSILGVIFASISSGLGELSFLSLTVFFSRDVLGGWGSGTGGAGVAGALLYSGLTQLGLSPQITLLIMLVVPFAMLVDYFFLLVPPPSLPQWKSRETLEYGAVASEERRHLMGETEEESVEEERPSPGRVLAPLIVTEATGALTFTEKLHAIKGLLRFVFPLGLVYFAEYFINQGLEEISKGKDTEQKESGLPFPHWICQPYVRPAPKEPVANGNSQGSEVRKAVCQKRALEDSDGAADRLSKNKQKKRSRNPNKNFCPELKPKYVKCEQCGNPKGNKCVFSLCRGCCKKKAFKEVADCPSHGLRFKTKADKQRAEEDESKKPETEQCSSSPQTPPSL